MGSSSSSLKTKGSEKAKNGGEWKFQVYFDPESDSTHGEDFYISDEELKVKMESIIDDSELIEKIWVYKHKLVWFQLTTFVFHHQVVVIETSEWWWSIEKNDEGITIQRSKKLEFVRDRYRRGKRTGPMIEMSFDKGRKKMKDLVDFLYRKDELNRAYSWFFDNCQKFAQRIFNEFAESKYHNLALGTWLQ